MKPKFRHLRSLASSVMLSISYVHAQSSTWNSDSAGNWSDTARWLGGTVASGADNTATLGNVITADRIITLDGNYTIGNITAADTSHNYTISGANILTLDRTDATAPTIDVTQSGRTLTISSQIAGSDGLTKTGAGTLVLQRDSGSNTYTGTTTLSAGTLQANAGTSLIASIANPLGTSALQLNGGTLQLRADSSFSSGAGADTIAWNNNTTVGGNVTINVERVGGSGSNKIHQLGTLSIGAHILTATDVTSANHDLRFGATTLTGNATFNVTNTGGAMNLTLGAITQSSAGLSITKTGSGTLTLSGASDHTGGTSISGGALTISNSNQLGASGSRNLTFTGSATLNTSGTPSLNVLTVNSGATATISNNTVTFASTTGPGNITFNGGNNSTQVLNLGNASAFTGNLQNNIGGTGNVPTKAIQFSSLGDGVGSRLRFGGSDSNSSQSARYLFTGASASLIMDNRQVELLAKPSTGSSFNRAILQNDNSSASNKWVINTNLINTTDRTHFFELRGSNIGENEFAGTIINSTNGGHALSLNKADAGTWIVSNASNSYTGVTNISGGTLRFASGALGSSGTINASGGTLLWHGGNTQDISSRLAFTAGATSTFNTNGNDVTFASAIGSSNTGNFVKTGLGTLTLQGTNTFTSGTKQLNGGGTLVLNYTTNDNRKLSTGALTLAGGTIVLKGGTTTAETASSTIFNTSNAGTFFVRDGGTAKINLNAFTVGTSSTVSFSDASMATTDRTNVGGILGAWFTVGNRWASNSTNAADGDIVGYTGATTLNLAALPAAATSVDVNYDLAGGGTLTAGRQFNTLRIESTADNQSLNIGASSLTVSNLTGTNAPNSYGGGLLYAGGANGNYTITDGGSTGRVTTENGNGQAQLINVHSGTLTVNAIVGAGTSAFVKSGEGTLVFNKANGYTGATSVYQGVLRLTGAGSLTAGTTVQNGAAIELGNGIAVANTSTLNITGTGISNGGALRNVATTSSSYAAAITIGTGGARINSDSGALTLTGGVVTSLFNDVTFGGAGNTTVQTAAISGAGGLVKDGAGTTTLSATNTYTGATTVNEGTLLVNGATAAGSTVGVSSGATLGGTGTINGAVNVSGVLSPGASIETLGSGTLSFSDGSTLAHELNSAVATSVGSDLLKVTGNLNLAGTVGLTLSDLALTDVAFNVDDVFSVINYTGTWNGGLFTFGGNELADAEEFTFGLNTWRINYAAPTGGLNFAGEHVAGSFVNLTVIPEPSSVALLGTLGAMMLLRRRR